MPAVAGVLPFLEDCAAGLATFLAGLAVALGAAAFLGLVLVAFFLAAAFALDLGGAAPLLREDFAFPWVAGEAFGFAGDACLLEEAFFVAIFALREEGWVALFGSRAVLREGPGNII